MSKSDVELSPRSLAVISALGCLIATSAVAIDISLPAIPSIAHHFSVSEELSQWIVTIYLAGFALGQIPIGLGADRFGRRPVILVCISAYVLAGVMAAMASSIWILLFFRFLQGLTGAAGGVTARAIARDIGGKEAPRLIALLTGVLGLAPLLAPIAGGVLTEAFGWTSTLLATAVYGLLTLILILAFVPETLVNARKEPPVQLLQNSWRDLWENQQSRYALALSCLPFAGYLALITSASTILIELYGLSPRLFGLVFAMAAIAYTGGAMMARLLLGRYSTHVVLRMGVFIIGFAGLLAFSLFVLLSPPLWFLWSSVMVFILGLSVIVPCATVLTLEPLPLSAGFVASVIGALQISAGFLGSTISASFYGGNENSMVGAMLLSAIFTVIAYLVWRRTLNVSGVAVGIDASR